MSNYRRTVSEGETFFFTIVSYHRQGHLCDETLRDNLRRGIKQVKETQPFKIEKIKNQNRLRRQAFEKPGKLV